MIKELIKNYNIQIETLDKIIQHPEKDSDMNQRCEAVKRFINQFIVELKVIEQYYES